MDIQDILQRLPQFATRNDLTIAELTGGITNKNYKITVDDESFVLRMGGNETKYLGIDRQVEYDCSRLAAQIEVAPEPIAFIEPEGFILARFIVRMNAFIHKNTIWRSGVVLKRGDNTALVKADTEDRKIYIWVSGKEDTRRDLLAMIRGEFDAIHKTIAKIEATEKVPLPNAPEADPVDLTFLQRLASEGRETLPVQVGNRIIDLIVKEVLSQIEKEGKSSQPNTVIQIEKMYGGVIGNNNVVNITQTIFQPIYDAIENSSFKTSKKSEITDEVDIIKNEVVKGDEANPSFLDRRLRNLKRWHPILRR